jgi:hypothetical protein
MAIARKKPFGKLVPEDITAMFKELNLDPPNPMWYVGRLDERETNGNGASHHGNGNGAHDNSDRAEPDDGH